jgi:hypothetical protein
MRHCLKNYKWYDYFFFIQDTWQLNRSFTLNYGLRYEAPGNAVASLYGVSDAIQQNLGGDPVFSLQPRPDPPNQEFPAAGRPRLEPSYQHWRLAGARYWWRQAGAAWRLFAY